MYRLCSLRSRTFLGIVLAFYALHTLHAAVQAPHGLIPVPKQEKAQQRLRNLSTWELGCGLIFAPKGAPLQYMDVLRARESAWFNLLSGDPTLTTRLEPGVFTIIIDFKRKLALQECTLKSFSMAGELKLYSAPKLNLPGHRSWKAVGVPSQIQPKDHLNIALGFLETQFLMLVLDVRQGGDISSLSCMGAVDIVKRGTADTKLLDDKNPNDDIPFNYARYYEGSQVDYVSSGTAKDANQVLDENFSQPYVFSKDDPAPTMVIDLEDKRDIESLSVLFDGPPGSFDFIFTDDVPEGLDKDPKAPASPNTPKTPKIPDTPKAPEASTDTEPLQMPEAPPALPLPSISPQAPSHPDPMLQTSLHPSPALLPLSPSLLFGSPSLVLAATEGSLEEAVSLGKLRAERQNLPPFIQALPESAQVIEGKAPANAQRLNVQFKDISTRYLVLHFKPDEAQNERNKNLNIYQVNLMGDVDIDAVLPDDVRQPGQAELPPLSSANLIDNLGNNANTLDNLDALVEPPELPVISP